MRDKGKTPRAGPAAGPGGAPVHTPGPIPGDGELLAELLADLDAFGVMLDRAQKAVQAGKPTVRLIPRGQVWPIAQALDELGLALTRRALQVRAQRALRDGQADATLGAVIDDLEAADRGE